MTDPTLSLSYITDYTNCVTMLLKNGGRAIMDIDDYETLKKYPWQEDIKGRARCSIWNKELRRQKGTLMYRLIMKAPKGMDVDHINHDVHDNRRCNLRLCSEAQNSRNLVGRGGTSRYKGVVWHKKNKRWEAGIKVNYKRIYLGSFHTEEEAALAYNEGALKYHGQYARLNEVSL